MTVAWGASLPQSPLIEGYDEQMPDLVIRSKTTVGPGKVRRVATTGPELQVWPLMCTDAQRIALKSFFENDAAHGTINITHTDIDGNAITFRITQPPKFRLAPNSHNRWLTDLQIMILP